jgi:hypothetical protein
LEKLALQRAVPALRLPWRMNIPEDAPCRLNENQPGPGKRRRRSRLFKAFYGVVLVLESFENRDQLGDAQQVLDFVGQVDDLDRAAGFFQSGVGADDLPEAGGVEIGDFGEIQNQLLFVCLDGGINGLPELVDPLTAQYFPLQVKDGDIAVFSFFNLHFFFSLSLANFKIII